MAEAQADIKAQAAQDKAAERAKLRGKNARNKQGLYKTRAVNGEWTSAHSPRSPPERFSPLVATRWCSLAVLFPLLFSRPPSNCNANHNFNRNRPQLQPRP